MGAYWLIKKHLLNPNCLHWIHSKTKVDSKLYYDFNPLAAARESISNVKGVIMQEL